MSDMNNLIESWRRSFSDLSETQLDELEDHLRQEVGSLRQHGLSEREAFVVAAMRCGRPAELSYEFARADQAAAWSGRLRWMIVGFLFCSIANGLLSALNLMVGGAMVANGMGMAVTIAMQMLMLSCVISAVIMLWHVWLKRCPRLMQQQPPSYLTSAWTLAMLVAVVPWLMAAGGMIAMMLLTRFLSPNDLGQLALSGQVTWLVLPFTTPLILLIIAVGLARQTAARPLPDSAE
jgi:hypothetical protein